MAARKKKPKRPRSARRADAKRSARIARDREKLWRLEPGGTPERPLEVETASLVEPRATDRRCPGCSGALHVEEHRAERREGRRLRVVRLICRSCGARPELFLAIHEPLVN